VPPPGDDGRGADAGGGGDAASDAEAGDPVNPGDPCSTLDKVYSKPCGLCGSMEATCIFPGKLSGFGPCHGEGECTPDASQACGTQSCGTRTCEKTCSWSITCAEPAVIECDSGTSEVDAAGCGPFTFHSRTCDKCTWTPFSACVDPNKNQMTVPATVGGGASKTWTVADGEVGDRPQNACGVNANLYPFSPQFRVAVELTNPTALTATVSIYQSKAAGATDYQMRMWAYKSIAPPGDVSALVACDWGVADTCIAGNPCGNGATVNYTGLSGVAIPAGGRILVYSSAAAPPFSGDFVLNVRTDALE
jgi:hypothetical protein